MTREVHQTACCRQNDTMLAKTPDHTPSLVPDRPSALRCLDKLARTRWQTFAMKVNMMMNGVFHGLSLDGVPTLVSDCCM